MKYKHGKWIGKNSQENNATSVGCLHEKKLNRYRFIPINPQYYPFLLVIESRWQKWGVYRLYKYESVSIELSGGVQLAYLQDAANIVSWKVN